MRLDQPRVELRPRSPWEAMELGTALVRTHARAIWLPWLLVTLPVFVVLNAIGLAAGLVAVDGVGDVVAEAGVRPHPAVRAVALAVRGGTRRPRDAGGAAALGMAGDAGLHDLAPAGPGAVAVPAGRPARGRRESRPAPSGHRRLRAWHRGAVDGGVHGLRARAGGGHVFAGDAVRAGRVPVGIRARDVVAAVRGTAAVGAGGGERGGLAGHQRDRTVLRRCRLRPLPRPAHPDRRVGHRDRVPAHAPAPAGAGAVAAVWPACWASRYPVRCWHKRRRRR